MKIIGKIKKNAVLKRLHSNIIEPLINFAFLIKWRRLNRHNSTLSVNHFHINNVTVGRETYGPIEVLYDAGSGRLTIGNYVSIAKNVKFFLGGGITI